MPNIYSLWLFAKKESLFFISLDIAVNKEQTLCVSPQDHSALRLCLSRASQSFEFSTVQPISG